MSWIKCEDSKYTECPTTYIKNPRTAKEINCQYYQENCLGLSESKPTYTGPIKPSTAQQQDTTTTPEKAQQTTQQTSIQPIQRASVQDTDYELPPQQTNFRPPYLSGGNPNKQWWLAAGASSSTADYCYQNWAYCVQNPNDKNRCHKFGTCLRTAQNNCSNEYKSKHALCPLPSDSATNPLFCDFYSACDAFGDTIDRTWEGPPDKPEEPSGEDKVREEKTLHQDTITPTKSADATTPDTQKTPSGIGTACSDDKKTSTILLIALGSIFVVSVFLQVLNIFHTKESNQKYSRMLYLAPGRPNPWIEDAKIMVGKNVSDYQDGKFLRAYWKDLTSKEPYVGYPKYIPKSPDDGDE